MNALLSDCPCLDEIPGFTRDPYGKPLIDLSPESQFAYGDLLRRTEQLILDQFGRGLVSGTTHTCLGQELAAMAVVRALDHPQDAVLSNHRNHGHFLTYSGDFVGLVAEVMGRRMGVCGGRGGSQHLAWRHFHSNGVQGGMTGIGVGLALARRRVGDGGVVATIIGDGTLGEGLLYESMNLASIWQVPVLFVVEHNGVAQTTDTRHTLGGTIEGRGRAFGLPTWRCGDDDPEFAAKVQRVVDELRAGGGPGLLVLDTRRMGPHSKGDDLRDPEEIAAIRRRDPLATLGRQIAPSLRARIEARNAAFVERVREAADTSPEASHDAPPRHIFGAVPEPVEPAGLPPAPPGCSVRERLNEALRHLLASSDQTVLLGEDLHDPYGGAFKLTQGLSTDFPGRVISTPISEAGITGAAIGMAMSGLHPIVEVMFADFLTLCMDQIYNHAVKFPGVFPGMAVPLVIRSPSGGRRGYGPTHSQSPENLFTAVPGLTVVYGSHRHDVGRLLVNAAQSWPYPVLFLEHKLLYGASQGGGAYEALPAQPEDVASELFPTLVRSCPQPDVTIVTYGGMLPVVEKAARRLEDEEELAVELIAPSLLAPLPGQALIARLKCSPRVMIVEESHHEFGVGAEIAARLLEAGFGGKFVRVGAPPVPIASARSLERDILPDEIRIIDEVLDLF